MTRNHWIHFLKLFLLFTCTRAFHLPSVNQSRPVPLARGVAQHVRPVVTNASDGNRGRGPVGCPAPEGSGRQSKRTRKDRGPNWTQQEILILISTKREMFLEEQDTIDGRDLMTSDNTKWTRISQEVMCAGCSPCVRDGPACKTKWNQLIPDYKRIADYLNKTGRNVPDY